MSKIDNIWQFLPPHLVMGHAYPGPVAAGVVSPSLAAVRVVSPGLAAGRVDCPWLVAMVFVLLKASVKNNLKSVFCFELYGPVNTIQVTFSWSVYPSIFFLDRLIGKWFINNQYSAHSFVRK
ncbi:MAG: hypothetical protein AB2708_20090 [Candidatus Thiodiazotropha taylori]